MSLLVIGAPCPVCGFDLEEDRDNPGEVTCLHCEDSERDIVIEAIQNKNKNNGGNVIMENTMVKVVKGLAKGNIVEGAFGVGSVVEWTTKQVKDGNVMFVTVIPHKSQVVERGGEKRNLFNDGTEKLEVPVYKVQFRSKNVIPVYEAETPAEPNNNPPFEVDNKIIVPPVNTQAAIHAQAGIGVGSAVNDAMAKLAALQQLAANKTNNNNGGDVQMVNNTNGGNVMTGAALLANVGAGGNGVTTPATTNHIQSTTGANLLNNVGGGAPVTTGAGANLLAGNGATPTTLIRNDRTPGFRIQLPTTEKAKSSNNFWYMSEQDEELAMVTNEPTNEAIGLARVISGMKTDDGQVTPKMLASGIVALLNIELTCGVWLNEVRVRVGKENSLYLSMPSRKYQDRNGKDAYSDYFTLSRQIKAQILRFCTAVMTQA